MWDGGVRAHCTMNLRRLAERGAEHRKQCTRCASRHLGQCHSPQRVGGTRFAAADVASLAAHWRIAPRWAVCVDSLCRFCTVQATRIPNV